MKKKWLLALCLAAVCGTGAASMAADPAVPAETAAAETAVSEAAASGKKSSGWANFKPLLSEEEANRPVSEEEAQESRAAETRAAAAFIAARCAAVKALDGIDVGANRKIANESYSEAIREVNRATSLDPRNASAWLLGAQIYRARGGMSYAKKYFFEAYSGYVQRAYEAEMGDNASPEEAMKYDLVEAVLCLASDQTYWPEILEFGDDETQRLIGRMYAESAVQKLDAAAAEQYDFQRLATGLLLDKQEEAREIATKILAGPESKIREIVEKEYVNMADKGEWYWRVPSREQAVKEFLLRNISLLTEAEE